MWFQLRRRIFSFSLAEVYQHPKPERRIAQFQQLNLQEQGLQPLKIVNPPYLHEAKAKDILEFVAQNSIPNNVRILHGLAHIQYNAFMSYVDTLIRYRLETQQLQQQFETQMRQLALEEGGHFLQLQERIIELGFHYGSLPVIPKLTLAIQSTSHSLIERIAVISLIHEGRGVRAVEKLLGQLSRAGDEKSAKIVRRIQRDEKIHFELGWKWFFLVCQLKKLDPEQTVLQINIKYKADIKLRRQP